MWKKFYLLVVKLPINANRKTFEITFKQEKRGVNIIYRLISLKLICKNQQFEPDSRGSHNIEQRAGREQIRCHSSQGREVQELQGPRGNKRLLYRLQKRGYGSIDEMRKKNNLNSKLDWNYSWNTSPGWNAFFSVLRNSSTQWSCTDKTAIFEFFNDTCVQGMTTGNFGDLCKRSRATDGSLTPEENTFKCLMNGVDVAFMNVSAAKKFYSGVI